MGNRKNRYLGSGAGTLLSGAWLGYSQFTTAKDLPADADWLGKMIADPPIYAPWLLFVVCVLFLAWVFWHRETETQDEAGGSTTNTLTSSGDQSPNMMGSFGPVHIGDIIHGRDGQPERCPDMLVADAIEAIQAATGLEGEAFGEFRQAARDGRITPWGRAEVPPTHLSSPMKWHDLWTKIPREHWANFKLAEDLSQLRSTQNPHTEAVEGHLPECQRYWSIKVDGGQIAGQWPPRAPRKLTPSAPHPDTSFDEVIRRVVKKLGPCPEGEQKAYIRRMNLEIADRVKLNRLTVWARFADFAIKPMSRHDLDTAIVDVPKRKISVAYEYGVNEYADVQFVSAEIDPIWPPEKKA